MAELPDSLIHNLEHYWGFSELRPFQTEAIAALLQGKDVLALAPTGGGKSICYQLPGVAAKGVCLVISPLIALMDDQVAALKKKGIAAAAVHSGRGKAENRLSLEKASSGELKLLYCSPERLKQRFFIGYLKELPISFLAVDEAHCISQWGHQFRPMYRKIAEVRELKPDVPIMALTASATQRVQEDIKDSLHFRKSSTVRTGFNRPNLAYRVAEPPSKLKLISELLKAYPGNAIIYVGTRAQSREIARALQDMGFAATNYHAGMQAKEKEQVLDYWQANEQAVVVATSAFGMGIDKASVRLVAHVFVPESLESYYQQAGRAGRDRHFAVPFLLFHPEDLEHQEALLGRKFPDLDLFKRVYNGLCNYFQLALGSGAQTLFDFYPATFAKKFNIPFLDVYLSLNALETADLALFMEGRPRPARLHFSLEKEALYDFQLKNQRYSGLLKYLQRVYGPSLFTNYVPIDLEALAKAVHYDQKDVEQLLQEMDSKGALNYYPVDMAPKIYFPEGRVSEAAIKDAYHIIEQQKQSAQTKWQHMKDYLHTRQCRQQFIANYFGEEQAPCGVCDNCRLEEEMKEMKRLANESRASKEDLFYLGLSKGIYYIEGLKALLHL